MADAKPKLRKRPHAISFDDPSLTKQSFRDECDVNLIVKRYTETGMINSIPRTTPQYGDAPEGDFLEAAIVNAEIASQVEAGDLDLDALGASKPEAESTPEPAPEQAEQAPQEAPADPSSTPDESA